MSKKMAVSLLASAALLATLVGCTSEGGAADPRGSTDSTLNQVLERGQIRVAVLPDFPPYSSQNSDGEFEGYEVDIARHLADALDVELELIPVDGPNRLAELQANRVDVNISAWTATNERAESVGFTIPYVTTGVMPLFRVADPITNLEDLETVDVTVVRGSIGDTYMSNTYPDVELTRSTALADCIEAVRAAHTDVCLEGLPSMVDAAAHDENLAVLEGSAPNPQLISMGVLQGDQIWLNYLNNFIRNYTISGANADSYQQWLDADLSDAIAYQD